MKDSKVLVPEIKSKPNWYMSYVRTGGFPTLFKGTFAIMGTLLEVSDEGLLHLDHIEGTRHGLFERKITGLEGEFSAWVYAAGPVLKERPSHYFNEDNITTKDGTQTWEISDVVG